MRTVFRKYFWPLFLLLQVLCLKALALFPSFIEQYYSTSLYPYLSHTLRLLFGFIPFSLGDILYMVFILYIIWWLWKNRTGWKKSWKRRTLSIVRLMSLLYLFFHLLWGINYHRVPLFEKIELSHSYSKEDLYAFTLELIEKSNKIHMELMVHDSLPVRMPYTMEQLTGICVESYQKLAESYPFLEYKTPSCKTSLMSTPLSYMGFSGYINPFTHEAQVNGLVPNYNKPTTLLHEMAHQLGYASETEANFIGYIASIHSENSYFRYSGYTFGLKYCLKNIERFEPGKSLEFIEKIHPGIVKNFEETISFREQYDTRAEHFFKSVYHYFLKANLQTDGLLTYNNYVGYMINYSSL